MPPTPNPNPNDDAELKSIVQSMIDAGESDTKIHQAIQKYDAQKLASKGDQYKGPDTFWGGVGQSLTSGEALKTGLQGGWGWIKGALDIPGSLMGMAETAGNLIEDPVGTVQSIPQGLRNMGDIVSHAGSDPDAFGYMTGQLTGQPLLTRGLVKGIPENSFTPAIPSAKYPTGKLLTGVGMGLERYRPLTGWMPSRLVGEPQGLRILQGDVGRGLQKIGRSMTDVPVKDAEIVPPSYPPLGVKEGQFTEVRPQGTVPSTPPPAQLYGPQLPEAPPPSQGQLPSSASSFGQGPSQPTGLPPSPNTPTYQGPGVDFGNPQSPTAGSHMNSPAQPYPGPRVPLTANSPFEAIQRRLYELVDKSQAGTLTIDELKEGQELNRLWRNHPQFSSGPPAQFPSSQASTPPAAAPASSAMNPDNLRLIPMKDLNPTIVKYLQEQGFQLEGADANPKFWRFVKK